MKIFRKHLLNVVNILHIQIKDKNWQITVPDKELVEILEKNKSLFKFTGRDVENFIAKCKLAHGVRVFSEPIENRFKLNKADINVAMESAKKHRKGDEKEDAPPPSMYQQCKIGVIE